MSAKMERKFERVSTLVLMTVYNPYTTEETSRAALIDISPGGVAFETTAEFQVDDTVIMRITYKKRKLIVLEGVIRRISSGLGAYRYGVEFIKLNSHAKKSLKQLMSALKTNRKRI